MRTLLLLSAFLLQMVCASSMCLANTDASEHIPHEEISAPDSSDQEDTKRADTQSNESESEDDDEVLALKSPMNEPDLKVIRPQRQILSKSPPYIEAFRRPPIYI